MNNSNCRLSVWVLVVGIQHMGLVLGQSTIVRAPNMLFVMVDDLRPALGIYGDSFAKTPNLDAFGSQSVVFRHAYTQYALCGPSRTSIMTSRKPHDMNIYDMSQFWRDIPQRNYTSLAQLFKQNGYETVPVGKIFHGSYTDHPMSWSMRSNPFFSQFQDEVRTEMCRKPGFYEFVCPINTEEAEVRNTRLVDRRILRWTQAYLFSRKFVHKPQRRPFFLALGFHRPHVPWIVPEEFPDLFPPNSVPTMANTSRFSSAPPFAFSDYKRLRLSPDFMYLNLTGPLDPVNEELRKIVTQYYYACVTYIDNLVGQLLETLDSHRLLDKTIINVISDHGFALGENGELTKMSNFEAATRVPWMIYDPVHTRASLTGFKLKMFDEPKGKNMKPYKEIQDPVELLDVFPTLVKLAGLGNMVECESKSDLILCSEGVSQAHVVSDDPRANRSTRGEQSRALSQYPRKQLHFLESSVNIKANKIATMGYSVRTPEFRYTEWVAWDKVQKRPQWNHVLGRELYDHRLHGDERENLANDTQYEDQISKLSHIIRKSYL